MFQTVREYGPVGLIPAAWLATGSAHAGYLSDQGMLIAHLVMAGFIAFFAITGWNRMDRGAFRAWRTILVVGFLITGAGIAGFFVPSGARLLFVTSLVGWMVLPAFGLLYTARELPDAVIVYAGSGGLSLLGAALFLGSLSGAGDSLALVAVFLVAVGQTASIVDAAGR